MASNRNRAKKILSAAEYELFLHSLPERTNRSSPAELRGAAERARNARDKQRDLFQRQSNTTRAEAGGRGSALGRNDRTRQKAELLDEVLERLLAAIDRAEQAAQAEEHEAEPAEEPMNRAERRAAAKGRASTVGQAGPARPVDAARPSRQAAGDAAHRPAAQRQQGQRSG